MTTRDNIDIYYTESYKNVHSVACTCTSFRHRKVRIMAMRNWLYKNYFDEALKY